MKAANHWCTLLLLSILLLGFAAAVPTGAQEGGGAGLSDPAQIARLQTLLDQAKQLMDAGQYGPASDLVREALNLDPQNKAAKKILAKAEEQTIKADPDALANEDSGDKAGSKETKEQAKLQETELESMAEQAKDALNQGDSTRAREIYDKMLSLDPENKRARKGLADLAEMEARQASKEAKMAAERDKEAARLQTREKEDKIAGLMAEAKASGDAGEYAKSIAAYESVLQLDPENRKAANALEAIKATEAKAKAAQADAAAAAREREARMKAEEESKALKTKIDGLVEQADLARKNGDFKGAFASYEEALKLEPNNKAATKGLMQLREAEIENEKRLAKVEDSRKAEEAARKEADLRKAEAERKVLAEKAEAEAKAKAVLEKQVAEEKEALAQRKLEEARKAEKAETTASAAPQQPAPAPKVAPAQVTAVDAPMVVTKTPATAPAPATAVATPAVVAAPPVAAVQAPPVQTAPVPVPQPVVEVASVSAANVPANAPAREVTPLTPEQRIQIDKMLNEAMLVYRRDRGNVMQSRDLWAKVLAIDPMNKQARTMMEETDAEYQRMLADQAAQQAATKEETAGREKLNTPITVTTSFPTPLVDFLQILSFASGINFSVSEGMEAVINASYVDKPLREVLDAELLPKGLKWTRTKGDIIVVEADLKTKVFPLTKDQMVKLQALMADNSLQKILYGPTGEKPLKKTYLQMDEREAVLIAADSAENIEKLTKFLADMGKAQPVALETRIYTIPEAQGPQIKALIDALIKADKTPYDLERNVFIEGKNLIVKDTPEHLKKIEQMLTEKEFIRSLHDGRLQIATFSLIPREAIKDAEMAADFASKIVEVVRTLLYAQTGEAKAAEEGRRLWFDPVTLQLTIIDYPDRIEAVGNYIAALPSIRQSEYEKVIHLIHQVAGDMEGWLNEAFDLAGGDGEATGDNATEITRSIRTEGEFTWRDLAVRLRRVNENDVDDDVDDSAELIIRTPTQSQDITLTEFQSTFVEDYEIVADDVRPSGESGSGRMTISVRYAPQGGYAQPLTGPIDPLTGLPVEPTQEEADVEDETLKISAFANQNALVVRYQNPADLEKVQRLIEQLDKPIPQVNIETRFVTVNEQRAKEFSSEWSFLDLSDPRLAGSQFIPDALTGPTPGTLQSVVNDTFGGGFGNDANELTSIFEPFIEQPGFASNLMKGTTVVNTVLGDFMGNQVNWELRLLEAEGIINVVNGPHVVVMNNESATFEITRSERGGGGFALTIPTTNSGVTVAAIDPAEITDNDEEDDVVLMEVSPDVTSRDSIILSIDVEITDFVGSIGGGLAVGDLNAEGLGYPLTAQRDFKSRVAFGTDTQILRNRKVLETRARVKDGGTIVLGGWTGEFSQDLTSGVPVLRNLPFVGKLLFSRNRFTTYKTTLLIFLSGNIVD